MNALEILGTRVVSAGKLEGDDQIQAFRNGGVVYRKLVFAKGRLKGFTLAGDIRCAGILTSLIKNQTEVGISALGKGLDRGFSYSPRLKILDGHVQH
jgi:NAD(P)H-nitrite reductase large subunit